MEIWKSKRRTVTSDQMVPDNNTGSNKVIIEGRPFYWDRYQWVMDFQAKEGDYDNAPICSDPENLGGTF